MVAAQATAQAIAAATGMSAWSVHRHCRARGLVPAPVTTGRRKGTADAPTSPRQGSRAARDAEIRRLDAEGVSRREIARQVRMDLRSLKRTAKRLGLPPRETPRGVEWTPAMDAALTALRTTERLDLRACAARLSLSMSTVLRRVGILGLSSGPVAPPRRASPWTPDRDATLRQAWGEGTPVSAIATAMGMREGQVHGRARTLGLPKRGTPLRNADGDRIAGHPLSEEKIETAFALLDQAARDRRPCPSDESIGDALGAGTTIARRALTALVASGRIKITRTPGRPQRVVTIVGAGRATMPTSSTWRAGTAPPTARKAPTPRPEVGAVGGTLKFACELVTQRPAHQDLRRGCCPWISGTVETGKWFYCNEPKAEAANYCATHQAKSVSGRIVGSIWKVAA